MSQFSNRCIVPSSPDSFTNTPLTTTSTFFDAAEAQPITVATGRESRIGGYALAMNQFSNRSIAPSPPNSLTNTHLTTTSPFLDAAEAQPITVATGRPGLQRNEIRDHQPGSYLSPSLRPFAPNPQNTPDTMFSPPYSHNQCPTFPGGDGSSRGSSPRTVRPPVGFPRGSRSTNSNIPSSRPSPSVRNPSSGDSTGTQSSTSVVGVGTLFGKVELRMRECGSHQRCDYRTRSWVTC